MGNDEPQVPVHYSQPVRPIEVKTYLMTCQNKMSLYRNKKVYEIQKKKEEAIAAIKQSNIDIAKSKMETIMRLEDLIVVYDILGPLCEILKERVTYLLTATQPPADVRPQLDTLIYASTRIEMEDLYKLRHLVKKQYGTYYTDAANQNRDGLVNPNVVEKLSIKPPSNAFLVIRLKQLCKEKRINFEFPEEIGPNFDGGMNNNPFGGVNPYDSSFGNNNFGSGGAGGMGTGVNNPYSANPYNDNNMGNNNTGNDFDAYMKKSNVNSGGMNNNNNINNNMGGNPYDHNFGGNNYGGNPYNNNFNQNPYDDNLNNNNNLGKSNNFKKNYSENNFSSPFDDDNNNNGVNPYGDNNSLANPFNNNSKMGGSKFGNTPGSSSKLGNNSRIRSAAPNSSKMGSSKMGQSNNNNFQSGNQSKIDNNNFPTGSQLNNSKMSQMKQSKMNNNIGGSHMGTSFNFDENDNLDNNLNIMN